jgi:GNAT superfamily N-acetyltransferase
MLSIHPVSPADAASLESVRALLRDYAAFLEAGSSACFHFAQLDTELRTLPDPYTLHNGEVLLATLDAQPAGCIAYRQSKESPDSCEIKRLFVSPFFRGTGVGDTLITTLLVRAAARGYLRAHLDTEPTLMRSANRLYRTHGFTEYTPPTRPPGVPIIYLERLL